MKKLLVFLLLACPMAALAASWQVPGDPALGPAKAAWSKATSVAVLPSGRMWVAYTTGSAGFDGIALAYSDNPVKGGWTDPAATLSEPGTAFSSAVLYADGEELALVFSSGDGALWLSRCSAPMGAQPAWTKPVRIGRGTAVSAPVCLSDGTWVLAVTAEGEGARVLTGRSDGLPWSETALVNVPEKLPGHRNDPVLFAATDGSLRMVLRSCGTTRNYVCRSEDGGRTWSSPTVFSPNPDRRFSLGRLPDGRLVYAKDARIDNNVYHLLRGQYLYLSEDDGRSWYGGLSVDKGEKADSPLVAVTQQGKIYIVYNDDEMGLCRTLLVATDATEIAASTPWNNLPARTRTVLRAPAKAKDRVAAEYKALTAPRKSWGKDALRVATYNIQYKNSIWGSRLGALERLFAQYDFDIVGAQEPYLVQIEDMMKAFGGRYDWIGTCVTGDNSNRNAHFNPIFYRKDRVELLAWDTIWYSEKPATPGYGAYSARLMIWARFRDRRTDREFYVFNSHFAWKGDEAREVSAHILVDAVRRIAGNMPAFCTGDFNCDEFSRPYQTILASGFLQDSMEAVSDPENVEYFSMSDYKPMSTVSRNRKHIDHIFYTPSSSRVLNWKLITDSYDGAFGSDHLPIVIEWKIAN